MTVRYCHLDKILMKEGDEVNYNDTIGIMGNTGFSSAAHLHIDCIKESERYPWHLYDMESGQLTPELRQLNLFIDSDLFGVKPVITTGIADVDYMTKYGSLHLAYDVVPKNRHETSANLGIKWNRSKQGKVISTGEHRIYGKYIHVEF